MPINLPAGTPLPPGGSIATPTIGSVRPIYNPSTGINTVQVFNGTSWVPFQEEKPVEHDFEIKYTARSVNSKRLLKEIQTLISEIGEEYVSFSHLFTYGIYDYSELVRFLEMYFDDLQEQRIITQYDVIADHRNNTPDHLKAGVFNLDLHFRQLHCINLSKINVVFSPKPKENR